MIKSLCHFFPLLLCIFLITGCASRPFVDDGAAIAPQDFLIDDFSVKQTPEDCLAYRDLQVKKEFGYCVYYDDASISVNAGNDGLHFDYELKPIYVWGNWFSIRKNTPNQFDYSSYSGVKIRLRSLTPQNVQVRVTLVDVNPNSAPYTSDEMWWCNFESLLVVDQWQVVACPFRAFVLSAGFGARKNDGHLDPSHISAYEISVISAPGEVTSGWMDLGFFSAYK